MIALLPGSREQEIRQNLPLQLEAARQIRDHCEDATFVVANPGHDEKIVELLAKGVEHRRFPGLHLRLGSPYDVMAAADLALVTSGTATIELTYFRVPMIVTYRTGALTATLGRLLTKTRHIGLVNILGGKEVVPEFFTHRDCSREIAERALELLPGGPKRCGVVAELARIREEMGGPGASERAARVILELARSRPRS
jgi:lipid-A-disaccharide synthase